MNELFLIQMLPIFLNASENMLSYEEQHAVYQFITRQREDCPHNECAKVLIDGVVDSRVLDQYLNYMIEDSYVYSFGDLQNDFMKGLIISLHYSGKIPLVAKIVLQCLREANGYK